MKGSVVAWEDSHLVSCDKHGPMVLLPNYHWWRCETEGCDVGPIGIVYSTDAMRLSVPGITVSKKKKD